MESDAIKNNRVPRASTPGNILMPAPPPPPPREGRKNNSCLSSLRHTIENKSLGLGTGM